MATHKYGNNGELIQVSAFDKTLMLTLKDIFPDDPKATKELLQAKKDTPKGKLQTFYNVRDNSALVRKIFRLYMKSVIVDVISGNCLYQFPGNSKAEVYMRNLPDNLVRSRRQRGYLKDFDLLATNYKVPRLTYSFSRRSSRQKLEVYVPKDYYAKIIEHANSGQPFSKRPKNINHFIPKIYEQFPYIKESSINKIIRKGSQRISRNLRLGEELLIIDKEGEIRFYRPLGRDHDKIMRSVKRKRETREKNKDESRTIS